MCLSPNSLLCFFFKKIKTPVTWIRAQPNNLILIDYLYKDSGFPGGMAVKNPPANAGDARDVGLIPGSENSPGVGNCNSP